MLVVVFLLRGFLVLTVLRREVGDVEARNSEVNNSTSSSWSAFFFLLGIVTVVGWAQRLRSRLGL